MPNDESKNKSAKYGFWGIVIAAFIGAGVELYISNKTSTAIKLNEYSSGQAVEEKINEDTPSEKKSKKKPDTQFNATHNGQGDINQSKGNITIIK